MNQESKSEFVNAVKAFAKQMQEMTEKDGYKRGLVILASEQIDGSNEMRQIISASGNHREILKAIGEFSTRKETMDLCRDGIKLGAIVSVFEKFGVSSKEHND